MGNGKLDVRTLESWLWEAACKIRGEVDAPKYKDYILPLIFLKRLSDVFDDELIKLSEDFGGKESAEQFFFEDHALVRFYIPEKARWKNIALQTTNLGEYLTDAVRLIAIENLKLKGVIDIKDFNETAGGQRVVSDEKLRLLIDILSQYRLGLQDVEADILGRAYEYLIRKFAEGSGQSAGEFYTPREVAILMSYILNPEPGLEIYDPCCGSGGLLIKCFLKNKEKFGKDTSRPPLRFYGQEILHSTFAMAKMNAFIHDMEAQIALGDTINRPAFTSSEGALRKFDLVIANPMWNQDFSQAVFENDTYNRFIFGYPPSSSADWGWIQHMLASLNDQGKMAVVLDTGTVSRGSGNVGKNRERDIRKEFVEKDMVEAVILMPENLFYNTTAAGIILVINKNKRNDEEILLINASTLYKKGRPKNFLPDNSIKQISEIYLNWEKKEGISNIVNKEEVIKNDYNLSPSRYVVQEEVDDTLPLEDAVVFLQETEEERKEMDENLKKILGKLELL